MLRRNWFGRTAALKENLSPLFSDRKKDLLCEPREEFSPSEAVLLNLSCKLESPGEI